MYTDRLSRGVWVTTAQLWVGTLGRNHESSHAIQNATLTLLVKWMMSRNKSVTLKLFCSFSGHKFGRDGFTVIPFKRHTSLKSDYQNVPDPSSLRSWPRQIYWVRKWCEGFCLLFCVQDGALDLLRELKNIKMSLETLQVINSTPLSCHSLPSAPEVTHNLI